MKNQMYDDYYYYSPPYISLPTRGQRRGGRGSYGYPLDYYDMKIIIIIMAMTAISIIADTKTHTIVMKIFKKELEEEVVEEQRVLLHSEVMGLLVLMVQLVI